MTSIAITGGIGSGKSYVSVLLQAAGIPVYNTDNEAKRLMLSDEGIRQDLIALLGVRMTLRSIFLITVKSSSFALI